MTVSSKSGVYWTKEAPMEGLKRPRHIFRISEQEFCVDSRYQITRQLGQGAYGVVCSARDNDTGQTVAVKKVTSIFSKTILTKRALREIKLLEHFRGHKNVSCASDRPTITNKLKDYMSI